MMIVRLNLNYITILLLIGQQLSMKNTSPPQNSLQLPQLSLSQDSEGRDSNEEGELSPTKVRINSTKNLHQMKSFDFSPGIMVKKRNEDKIRKLKNQKQKLRQSLQILKNGAVSAIIEKDQIIQRMKGLSQPKLHPRTDEENQSSPEDIETFIRYIHDLEEDREHYRKELEKEKKLYERELVAKDNVIDQLAHELNWSNDKIDNLEQYGQLLQEKIKIIEADNENLSIMLNRSQETVKVNHTEKSREDETGKLSHCSRGDDVLPLNLSSSVEGISSLDESIVENRIRQLKSKHHEEMVELTRFYEGQLECLKKICEREEQSEYQGRIMMEGETLSIDNKSHRSAHRIEKILKKNQSLGSFKSNPIMETIYQNEETGYRKNLRKDILEDIYSNKTSTLKSENKKFDEMSEFSSKFFSYPTTRIFKKMKSEECIENERNEGSPWKNIMWFALGTVAGGSLLTLTHKLFNNK